MERGAPAPGTRRRYGAGKKASSTNHRTSPSPSMAPSIPPHAAPATPSQPHAATKLPSRSLHQTPCDAVRVCPLSRGVASRAVAAHGHPRLWHCNLRGRRRHAPRAGGIRRLQWHQPDGAHCAPAPPSLIRDHPKTRARQMDRVLVRTRCAPASAFIEVTPWGVLHGVRMWTRATSFVQQPATPFLQVWGLFPSTGRAELPVEQPQYRVQ